jgi:hypothetical protein
MKRIEQQAIIEHPAEAEHLAVAAAKVLDDKQLWNTPEIGVLFAAGETKDYSALPIVLSVGATRKVTRGLRAEVARPLDENGFSTNNLNRLKAGIYLMQLGLPRIASS